MARPVSFEDANGCIVTTPVLARTPEEALQCARTKFGDAVLPGEPEYFTFAVTCPHTGCSTRTHPGRDHDGAQSCAEFTAVGCTVEDGPCP